MNNESGPKAAASSVVEAVKGRAREAAGAATGDESLRKEGRAQQDKADAERDVASKEAAGERRGRRRPFTKKSGRPSTLDGAAGYPPALAANAGIYDTPTFVSAKIRYPRQFESAFDRRIGLEVLLDARLAVDWLGNSSGIRCMPNWREPSTYTNRRSCPSSPACTTGPPRLELTVIPSGDHALSPWSGRWTSGQPRPFKPNTNSCCARGTTRWCLTSAAHWRLTSQGRSRLPNLGEIARLRRVLQDPA